MENTINELRKFAEWCEFKTTAALRQGIELAIENYIKEKQCDVPVVSQQRELLMAFKEWEANKCKLPWDANIDEVVNQYLSINCC